MSEAKYKVGDEVLIKAKIGVVDTMDERLQYRFVSMGSAVWVGDDVIVGPAKPEPKTVPADPHGWRFFHQEGGCLNMYWAFCPERTGVYYPIHDNGPWLTACDSIQYCVDVGRREVTANEVVEACGSLPPEYPKPQPQPEFPHPMYLMYREAAK